MNNKSITKVPQHYRLLGGDEVIRKGDLYKSNSALPTSDRKSAVGYAAVSVGRTVDAYNQVMGSVGIGAYSFYRRQHKRVKVEVVPPVKPVESKEYPSKSPLVTFFYPSRENPTNFTRRSLRMIAGNSKYIIGLDVNDKFKFKKFRRDKASMVEVVEFNVNALK